jgi:hypothetical protein
MGSRASLAPRGTWSATAIAVLAAVAALLTSACGLGDKARLEDRITGAPARLEGSVVAGTVTVESRLTDVPAGVSATFAGAAPPDAGGPAPTFPKGGVSFGQESAGFVLDLAGFRAALLTPATAEQAPAPVVLFDDLVLYGRRGGIPLDDARPWVRLDLDDVEEGAGALDPLDGAGTAALAAIHPALLVDLAAGTLTGSIERRDVGAADAALAPGTTRYAVNVSVRKALQDTRRSRYPEQRREAVEELLRLLGVVGDLHPGEVWLDEDGRLRRFRVELRQEPQRKIEFRMIVSVDLPPVPDGTTPTVGDVPGVEQVLGVDSVLRFTSTVTAKPDEPEPEQEPAPAPEAAP